MRAPRRQAAQPRDRRPPIVAYLQLAAGAPTYTRAVLEGHVASLTERSGYRLVKVFTGIDGDTELLMLRRLLDYVHISGQRTVLLVGQPRTALAVLHRLPRLRVLTMADLVPVESPAQSTVQG
jgi:hypothetical protein